MAKLLTALVLSMPSSPAPAHVAHVEPGHCQTHKCEHSMLKKHRAKIRHKKWLVVKPYNAWLNSVAWCESTFRWWLNTGNGFYGGLQFTIKSWIGVGGRGMPHQASMLEQKFRGVKLRLQQGTGAWPNCG